MTSNIHILETKSLESNHEMGLTLAYWYVSEYSISKSTTNIILDPIDDIKDDIHHASKKIQLETKCYDIKQLFFGGQISGT